MTQEARYPKLPLEFTKCPNCECEDTVAMEVVAEEVERGAVTPGMGGALIISQVIVRDQMKNILSYPVINYMADACLECGTLYVRKAAITVDIPKLQVKPKNPLDPNRRN